MFGKRGSLFWMNMHSMHAEIHTGEMAPGSFLQQDSLKIDDSICSYHSEQMISGYTCRRKSCKGTIWPYVMKFWALTDSMLSCSTHLLIMDMSNKHASIWFWPWWNWNAKPYVLLAFLSFLLADLSVTTPPESLESFRWQYWVCVTPLMWMY